MAKDKPKEPTVTILGEEVTNHQKKHHPGDGGVMWGVFLIFAGLILLFNTFNIVPWIIWEELIRYWPLLLVLIGTHIILGNNFISRIVVTLLSIIFIGSAVLLALQTTAPNFFATLPTDLTRITQYWEELKR